MKICYEICKIQILEIKYLIFSCHSIWFIFNYKDYCTKSYSFFLIYKLCNDIKTFIICLIEDSLDLLL